MKQMWKDKGLVSILFVLFIYAKWTYRRGVQIF